jgi:hypothetical protein
MSKKEPYSIEFKILTRFLDPNRIKGRDWRNVHSRYEKVKREINLLVSGKTPEKPLTSFQISCLRRSGGTLDYDNLIASLKPFIDGIKLSGIIKDDSWKYIRWITVDQEIAEMPKGYCELVFTIKEVLKQKPVKKKIQINPCDEILKKMHTFSMALLDGNMEWVKEHLEQFVKVTENNGKV